MKCILRADGSEAVPDDMPPAARAVAFLLEHANQRRDDELPLPCLCRECEGHRAAICCTVLEDGTLAVDLV